MTAKTIYEAVKEKALADKEAGASPPPTLPTFELQNIYDSFRKDNGTTS